MTVSPVKPSRRISKRRNLVGAAFAAPFLVGLVVLIIYPILASGYYSFTDFNLFQSPKFVGLDNYARMLEDDRFLKSLWNTMWLTLFGVPLSIILALLGAHIMNLPVKGQPLYRALVYLPTIVPVVVGGYLWRWLLNAQYGYINRILEVLHIPQPLWLEDPGWTKPAILMVALWTVGGTMIIYLAAMKDISAELYEAASIDGAGVWKKFLHITWPALTPITLFQVIVLLIAYLQIFTQPYLLTQTRLNQSSGGPNDSMLSYAMYLFQNAFTNLKMGYASAMAWILFLITMAITAVLLVFTRKWVHYGSR